MDRDLWLRVTDAVRNKRRVVVIGEGDKSTRYFEYHANHGGVEMGVGGISLRCEAQRPPFTVSVVVDGESLYSRTFNDLVAIE